MEARSGARTNKKVSCAIASHEPVAQRIEHLTTNQEVGGSIPFGLARKALRPSFPPRGAFLFSGG